MKVVPGGKVWSYEWNAGGMLARVIRPDGDAVTFAYDPLGRRIAKTYKGKTTKWVWDGNVPLHEWTEEACAEGNAEVKSMPDANADVIQAGHQARIAPISAQGPPAEQNSQSSIFNSQLTTWLFEPESFSPMAKIVDGQSYSIVTDHLGTPFEMYNSAGMRTWAAELDIYGAVRAVQEGAAVDCPFRYPGQYEDEETGLYYNRFRYYDPEAGGYVSQDPIGLAGGNPTLYGYVGDSIVEFDPLGLAKCGTPPKSKKATQLEKNRKNGADWEKKVSNDAKVKYGADNVQEQVLIRPLDNNGNPVKYRVRADNTIQTKNGINVIDAKASPTATYTKNQKKGYPLLGSNGGIIESGPNKGTILPPTSVKRIDPSTINTL